MSNAILVRWSAVILRLALAAAFASAVADRFGLWGPHGAPAVAWGDWQHFRAYSDQLNWFLPSVLRPAAALLATLAEGTFAVALILGVRLRETAFASAVLLFLFGFAMTLARGPKPPLDYSVFTAAAAALFLAVSPVTTSPAAQR